MTFDSLVQWTNAARDTMAITDLFRDDDLLVSWKYDEKRTGKVQNVQDTINVENLWDNDARRNRINIRLRKLLYPEKYSG